MPRRFHSNLVTLRRRLRYDEGADAVASGGDEAQEAERGQRELNVAVEVAVAKRDGIRGCLTTDCGGLVPGCQGK